MRLRLGLSPTSPLQDAGMRIDPPPSDASAIGAMPAATAAPAPPEDPPGVCTVFHGLRVLPCRSDSVIEIVPNSGVVVLPISTNPASRNRSTTGSSRSSGVSGTAIDPYEVGHPATAFRSLIGIGTPRNGGSSSTLVPARRSAAALASARARSSSRREKALSCGSSSSTRAR